MTIKQKFSSIDQSKLTADQKAFLEKIKNVTKDFTDSEMNKKVEQPLDNFIAKAKEKMPEAIKSAPAKRTTKAKPSQTRKPKRTAMSLAKEIRKEGESWNEARARASKMMKEDSKDLSKTVESELDKLSKLVRSEKTRSKLVGISGTDIKRDASRKAKPRGARKVTHSGETSNQYGTFSNHVGRKYYESRDRHSDRLAPRYPKNAPLLADGGGLGRGIVLDKFKGQSPNNRHYSLEMFTNPDGLDYFRLYDDTSNEILAQSYDLEEVKLYAEMFKGKRYAEGGYLTDPTFGTFQNQVFADGGDIDAFTLRMVKSNGIQPAEVLKEDTNVMYNKGGAVTNERRYVNKGEDYEVRYSKPILRRKGYQGKRNFATGGGVGDFDVKLLVGKRVVYEVKVDTLKKAQRIGNEILSWEDDGFEYTIIGYDSSNNKIFENKRLLSDEFPAKLKDKFDTLQLNVIVANPKQNKLDAGSFTTYRALLNIVDDFEEANFRVTINGKTFYEDDYELGGVMATDLAGHTGGGDAGLNAGMPLDGFSNTGYTGLVGETGAMSSGEMFMAGGSLNNPKNYVGKHFIIEDELFYIGAFNNRNLKRSVRYLNKLGENNNIKGNQYPMFAVLIMKINDRLDLYDKNQSIMETSKAYINLDRLENMLKNSKLSNQKLPLKFAEKVDDSKKYFNEFTMQKYEHGGGLPDGSSQSYMITEAFGNPAQHFATGGAIKNQYTGRKPADVWNKLTKEQRNHFLYDHKKEISDEKGFELSNAEIIDSIDSNYNNLDYHIKSSFENHIEMGQYARGGGVRKVGNREYSYGRNWTNDFRHINKAEEHEVTYNRKGKFLGIFDGGGETYYEKASQLKGGVNYYSVDIDLENGDEVRDLTFKSLDEAKKEFLKYSNSMVYDGENIDDIQLVVSFKNGDYENIYLNKGGAITNERRYVNKGEDYEVRYSKPILRRKGYQGKRDFMAGGSMETPRIYVADLEAYNNGRLVGEWLDLADYNDADELMDAIQDVLKKSGGEEYAIHDVEYVPRSLYSEYMGRNDFQALYEVMETAKRFDLPLEVVQEIVSQYGEGGVDEFYGKYDSAEDFAYQQVEELGLENFSSPEYYVYISETDRRLISQEEADTYVDDIKYEDGGNRLIEEADMDVEEYEEGNSEMQEEMLDKAREIVYDRIYDRWYDSLDDPYSYLVEELGYYEAEDFFKASFVNVDYEKLGRDLEYDYTFIEHDGDLYVFNIR
jgi:antirestriction protein